MKYIIALIIILLLAGCTGQTNGANETSPNNETIESPEVPETNSPESTETFALSPGDFETSVVANKFEYVMAEANEYGDESSVRNVAGTTMYEANAELKLTYTPLLTNTKFYLKILGYGYSQEQDNIVYEGELTQETVTIPMTLILLHPGQEARIKFCYGFTPDFDPLQDDTSEDIICISKLFAKPNNDFKVNLEEILIKTEIDEDKVIGERSVFVQNTGSTPMTVFTHIPEAEPYMLKVDKSKLTLQPNEEVRVTFNIEYAYEGEVHEGREIVGMYILPKACEPSEECFTNARLRKELEIEIK